MVEVSASQLTLAIIWFFIGFGAGFFILRLWLYILVGIILAFLLPFILPLLGVSSPFTPEQVIDAIERGITTLATFIAKNNYSITGFILGVVIGTITALVRR